jgi:hypothetical protein
MKVFKKATWYVFLLFSHTKVTVGAIFLNKIYKFSHSRLGHFVAWTF